MYLHTYGIPHVCIGTTAHQCAVVVITAYDFESGRPGSNSELGPIYYIRLRSLHRAYPSLHPFEVVHWAPEQLNKKAVTGACKLIDGCSPELCSATPSVASFGICHRNKVNSIARLYRGGPELSTGHFSWTRPDPTRPGETLTRPDLTRDCRQKVWPDPTRPAARPFPHMCIL